MSENLKEILSKEKNQVIGEKFVGIKIVEQSIEDSETIYSYNGNKVENTVQDLEDVADLLVNADGVENMNGKKIYYEVADTPEETIKDVRNKGYCGRQYHKGWVNS